MLEWWNGLEGVTQGFYSAALFFSVFFVWQMIAALIGADDGGADADAADGGAVEDFDPDIQGASDSSLSAFRLLSLRSVLTFLTLFTWGTALYLDQGRSLNKAMGISVLWGVVGMLSVTGLLYLFMKMVHNGTKRIESCIGAKGVVYVDISENGTGEVKVPVSNIMSHVKARSADGRKITSGTPVKVIRRLDQTTVEVDRV